MGIQKPFSRISQKKALTFIEVMVALVILTSGLVAIFRILITSLDQLNHLTNRLYASTILDNRIGEIERNLRVYKVLPIELQQAEVVDVGGKDVTFEQEMTISALDGFTDIFYLELTLKWKEANREVGMSRSAYLSENSSTQ